MPGDPDPATSAAELEEIEMPTNSNRSPWARVVVEIRTPRIRRPTLQSLVVLSGLWVLVGMFIPHSRLAVYACVPAAPLIARLARKIKATRTPTAMTFVANVTPLIMVVLTRTPLTIVSAGTARDRLIVAIAVGAVLIVQEALSRAWPHPADQRQRR
jgi:hypothetical protein